MRLLGPAISPRAPIRQARPALSPRRAVAILPAWVSRLETGQWLLTDVTEGEIELESVGVRLGLDDVYAKTDDLPFDPADEPLTQRA